MSADYRLEDWVARLDRASSQHAHNLDGLDERVADLRRDVTPLGQLLSNALHSIDRLANTVDKHGRNLATLEIRLAGALSDVDRLTDLTDRQALTITELERTGGNIAIDLGTLEAEVARIDPCPGCRSSQSLCPEHDAPQIEAER